MKSSMSSDKFDDRKTHISVSGLRRFIMKISMYLNIMFHGRMRRFQLESELNGTTAKPENKDSSNFDSK